jgi:hypothetical protein
VNSPNIICVLSVLVHDDQILAAAPARLFFAKAATFMYTLLTLFVFGDEDAVGNHQFAPLADFIPVYPKLAREKVSTWIYHGYQEENKAPTHFKYE